MLRAKVIIICHAGINDKVFHIEDATLASLCISGMVRWVHRWYRVKGRYSADEIANQIAEFALNTVRYEAST